MQSRKKLTVLKKTLPINVDNFVKTLLSIPFAWNHVIQEERTEPVEVIFMEVDCDSDKQKVVWVNPWKVLKFCFN
jgi:hypothetical protein